MRKLIYSLLATLLVSSAYAEDGDKNCFNHLSVGVSVGTPGIGIDVAMPVCDYVQLRGGVAFVPNIKFGFDLDLGDSPDVAGYDIPETLEAESKVGFVNGLILADVFPFKSSSFHVTVGAYFGSSKVVKAYNKEEGVLMDLTRYNAAYPNDRIGYELGDYLLTADEEGNVNAEIKTASFKPYVGIGFGRAVPKKGRVGFMTDIGVQFWGTPKVYCNDTRLSSEDLGGDDGGITKFISNVKVYPVINFRLCCRIL